MAHLDAVTLEAIDKVIENKDKQAEWDDDQMRSALIDVESGSTQPEACEGRDISQGTLSKRVADMEEYKTQLRSEMGSGEELFTDPVERVAEDLGDFFDKLNEDYDFGIKDLAIRMITDEVRQNEELPSPMSLGRFLDEANSGITNSKELDWIVRRYNGWYEQKQQELQQNPEYGGPHGGGMPISDQGGSYGGQSPMGGSAGASIGPSGMGGQSPGQPPMGGQMRGPNQNGTQPQGQTHQSQSEFQDPRIEQIQNQVEELTGAVAALLEGDSDDGETEMVRIQQGDDLIEIPADDPRVDQLLGDDEDMLDQMTKMAEVGIIDLGNDGGDEMAQAVGSAIEELGQKQLQAQQQMSANFQQVIESMQSMQESDGQMSADDVREVVEDTLTKSETERLREEMDDRFSRMMDMLDSPKFRGGEGTMDPDYLKKDREMEFKEQQLETLNKNIREMPQALAVSVRDGLVPALKEMQHASRVGGRELWRPPGATRRGEPEYEPDVSTTQPRQSDSAEQRSDQETVSELESRASEVRNKIGLDGDGGDGGVEA